VKLKIWAPLACLAVFMMFAGAAFAQDVDDATPLSPTLQSKVNRALAEARAAAPAREAELAKNGAQSQPVTRTKPVSDATISCSVSYSSGSGANATTFCVTVNGNIPEFSVAGQEMIFVGSVQEGYGICDTNEGVNYYDYAEYDSGNWAAPTFTHVGNTVTVTRLTADGLWSLKQTIVNVPATATGPGSAKVTMIIKNLSGISKTFYLYRYADVDANDTTSPNDFDFTLETAFGLDPGFNRGLSTTNNTFSSSIGELAYSSNYFDGPNPCSPFNTFGGGTITTQPFQGDGSVDIFWDGTLAHNGSKTVSSTYKPI